MADTQDGKFATGSGIKKLLEKIYEKMSLKVLHVAEKAVIKLLSAETGLIKNFLAEEILSNKIEAANITSTTKIMAETIDAKSINVSGKIIIGGKYEVKKIFIGTKEEWDNLNETTKAGYDMAEIIESTDEVYEE